MESTHWNFATAAHLLNRAGFGGTPAEAEVLVQAGPEGAVDRLLDFGRVDEPLDPPEWAKPDPNRAETLRELRSGNEEERRRRLREEQAEQRRRTVELRHWWVRRMATTRRPLEEKMVLFWHGHFATSIQKVRDPWLMYRQLALFRQHAVGRWTDLLLAVTRDPAMLIWLDQARSRREQPNENYAREVMELFALGEGHYSEKDVRETARALTGLGYDRLRQEPEWRPRQHDPGTKTVLGHSGNLGPDDAIRVIAEHPESGRFLARKLWTFFAAESVPPGVIEALAKAFRSGGGEFRPLLRRLFLAREFYAPDVVRTQIKSPAQWLAMALRQLERPAPRPELVNNALRDLGQELLAPPNVKGWDGGLAWINTGTLVRRQQFAALLVSGLEAAPGMVEGDRGRRLRERLERAPAGAMARHGGGADVGRLFSPEELADRPRLLAALERRFLPAGFRPALVHDVREVLGDDRTPDPRAVREAVRVVMQSTDYQLA